MVNIMEDIVKSTIDEVLENYDCCKCEKCKSDMITYALNKLPPRYVINNDGEAMARFALSRSQEQAEVLTAIVKAIQVVSNNPRHNVE